MIIKIAQRCQSGMLAHINRDVSCINNPRKKFSYTHLQGSTLGDLTIDKFLGLKVAALLLSEWVGGWVGAWVGG